MKEKERGAGSIFPKSKMIVGFSTFDFRSGHRA